MQVSNLPKSKQESDRWFFLAENIELTQTKHVCHSMKILGKHPFFSALDTSHSIPSLFIPFSPSCHLRIPPRPLRALVVIPRCAKRPYTFSALHQAVWGWRWLEVRRCKWSWRQRILETSFEMKQIPQEIPRSNNYIWKLLKRHTSMSCLNATIACQSQFQNSFQVSAMSVCCAWAKNKGLMSWGCWAKLRQGSQISSKQMYCTSFLSNHQNVG